MAESLHILAIHAHPDDIEMLFAGTLMLLKEQGHQITLATMTPGDKGSAEYNGEQIAAIRRAEGANAARLLDSPYHCLEFRDLQIVHDNDARRRVTEFLRQIRPQMVITAAPVDYMADHEITSRLVRDACFAASVPNYVTGATSPAPCTQRIPYLYYADPVAGLDGYGQPQPVDFVVDISSTLALKKKMLAAHESQRAWLLRQHGMDEYLASMERFARQRGELIGATYGEGFRQHAGHPHPHDNLLAELVGGKKPRPQ